MPVSDEQHLLTSLAADPYDALAWQALADVREEAGDPRGELLRLHLRLRAGWESAESAAWRRRVDALQSSGVRFDLPRWTNGVGMEFALLPPGCFWMGSPVGEEGRIDDELQHGVELSRPLWVGVYPVTQGEYERVMGTNPSRFRRGGYEMVHHLDPDRLPVESVSWEEAAEFCRRLCDRPEERERGRLYRLLTEAEWEYSCRGGSGSSIPFHFGYSLSSTQANFNGNYPYDGGAKGPNLQRPTAVGSYASNGWGLFDLHGNVWEWCGDFYGDYPDRRLSDPAGPPGGSNRVIRGGSWFNFGYFCRSAYRFWGEPASRSSYLGFRVALVPS